MGHLPRLLALVLVVAGCRNPAFLDDVVRGADDVVRAGRQADGSLYLPQLPRPVPPAQVETVIGRVGTAARNLAARHLADLNRADAAEVVRVACTANDLYQTVRQPTLADAVAEALRSFGGPSARRSQVQALAQDLSDAQDSGDVVQLLAVSGICAASGATGG